MVEALKIICRTPTQGRSGVTRIPKWKYDCVKAAILGAFDQAPHGRVQFKNLADMARLHLTEDQLTNLGSVKWHVTTVKLNMEVEGELCRVPGLKPQTLEKAPHEKL